jgi:hypothetical protein
MDNVKFVGSPDGKYHRIFNRNTGATLRWGRTQDENPVMSPQHPEILDVEISEICNGPAGTPCSFCYKSNTPSGNNMSVDTFSHILDLTPETDQVALGIGDVDGNPDLWNIMQVCRSRGIVPNITTNGFGVTEEVAAKFALLCGAVAVSHYGDNVCFNAIDQLYKAGLGQINIHKLLARETLASCFRLIDQVVAAKAGVGDSRLVGLKAIVFLLLKPKGNRNTLHSIDSLDDYKRLLEYAIERDVQIGFDSCSGPMALKNLPAQYVESVDPCESTLFSLYLNVKAEVFPCSFTEGTPGWETGIDSLAINDFKDIWYHPRLVEFRNTLLKSSALCDCSVKQHCRSCVIYDVTVCNRKPNLPNSDQLVNIHD